MSRHRHRRWLFLLALFGALAQACLPVAHAALMSAATGGMAWCGPAGTSSPALQAQLAEFPQEIRQILSQDTAQADLASDCAQFCAAVADSAAPPIVPVSVALRTAGLEQPLAEVVPPARRALASSPPSRGPPAASLVQT